MAVGEWHIQYSSASSLFSISLFPSSLLSPPSRFSFIVSFHALSHCLISPFHPSIHPLIFAPLFELISDYLFVSTVSCIVPFQNIFPCSCLSSVSMLSFHPCSHQFPFFLTVSVVSISQNLSFILVYCMLSVCCRRLACILLPSSVGQVGVCPVLSCPVLYCTVLSCPVQRSSYPTLPCHPLSSITHHVLSHVDWCCTYGSPQSIISPV